MLLEIGDLAPASQHYYVRIDGGDTVYLMRKLIVDMYSAVFRLTAISPALPSRAKTLPH